MTNPENESLVAGVDASSVQIVRGGEIEEEELAALVAGIVAASAASEPDAVATSDGPTRWKHGARRRQTFPRNKRDAWRWSLR